ncbi:MAG: hypothetical protein JJV95_00805 [Sulfurospirillum sp.]|nr:hypothetical protein [Sulfurospirillum sp.]
MDENRKYIEEDEIDLMELFKTIQKNRWIVVIFTCVVTLGAIVYSYMQTPVYEAKALVEIGKYNNNNNNNNNNNERLLDDTNQLSMSLNTLYIDMLENTKNRVSGITEISIPKNTNNFLEIKAEAISNKLAIKEVQIVVSHMQEKHKKILDDIKKRREFEIHNFDIKINNIKTKDLELVNEEIVMTQKNFYVFFACS